ncbi:MAG: LLM class flavin-dependent oxidoreductase [Hyphomicrobiales bacterium]|nr:LLM class flavin-dependent oxidoreductase [Hyphomicrobiales bacterium]MDE1971675.1 LLM class flavin-dependent oxidoreductase [Hyphomicrobiales bacterium]MDE2284262.1 LLM class flavin-dependent oxidoreductase [Hyphomicrobiales bacterium]
MAGRARFDFIHFMHYVHLPENQKDFPSLWVDFPNKYFDPEKGYSLYQRYLSELVLADKLGFDAIVVNEHHNTAYSMMPAPNLIAASLIPQVRNAKICVWGTPPNLEYPNRLAEEYAMLDVLSQGRLEVAFPLGTGMEYWANPINPSTARARYRESIDIILQAWTQDGPTKYYGDFYTYRYLNPWPRPVQKPHPPCYIVGTGSPETIDLAAQLGFGYASVFVTKSRARELNEKLRRTAAEHGHHISPEQLPLQVITYVAETEQKARDEGIDHIRYFFEDALRTTPTFLAPPGYLSVEQLKMRAALADKLHGKFDFDNVNESFFVAVGTADQVVAQLEQWGEQMGTNHFVMLAAPGNMPNWKVVKNLNLIAQDVIPRVRVGAAYERRVAAE